MRRECQDVFPATDLKGNRYLAIPACITARASRACRDACRDRLPAVAGKTFPASPVNAQLPIFHIWKEAHDVNSDNDTLYQHKTFPEYPDVSIEKFIRDYVFSGYILFILAHKMMQRFVELLIYHHYPGEWDDCEFNRDSMDLMQLHKAEQLE